MYPKFQKCSTFQNCFKFKKCPKLKKYPKLKKCPKFEKKNQKIKSCKFKLRNPKISKLS